MKPVELNPRELLAAFPGGQRKPPFRPRVPRGAAPSDDPADAHSTANQPSPAVAALDAARAADPLSPPVMFAALDSWPGSRGLAALLRVQLALGRFGARPMLRFACAYWPGCLLSVAVWDFGGDRFSQRNLAVGTAASLVFAILGLLPFLTPIVLSYGMRGLGAMATGRAAAPPKPDFNLHAMAGIVRWIQLVGSPEQQQDTPHLASKDFDIETSAPPQHSLVLLAHEDGDSACPCPRPTCAGSLLGASSTFAFLDLSIKMLFAIWLTLLFSWTPLVTLGSQTWRVWWGAVLGVAALLGMFVFIVLNNLVRRITNIRLLALQGRIHRRLLAIALEDLVERSALALSNGNPTESYLPPEPEPYEVLHGLLATAWRTGLEFLAFGRLGYVIFLVVFIISAAIDAIGAGCIPLWCVVLTTASYLRSPHSHLQDHHRLRLHLHPLRRRHRQRCRLQ
ncbi:hypothetical protein DFJ74DRAFT_654344 [Hyaloraphidium curvatum]|nr:hypothetical protein DFJ74DRAFT_654344 [Hyaloraphidium curvatum]